MRIKTLFSVILIFVFTAVFTTVTQADVCPGSAGVSPDGHNVTVWDWDGKVPLGWGFSVSETAQPGSYTFAYVNEGAPYTYTTITCHYVSANKESQLSLSKSNAIAKWYGSCGDNRPNLATDCPFSVESPADK